MIVIMPNSLPKETINIYFNLAQMRDELAVETIEKFVSQIPLHERAFLLTVPPEWGGISEPIICRHLTLKSLAR